MDTIVCTWMSCDAQMRAEDARRTSRLSSDFYRESRMLLWAGFPSSYKLRDDPKYYKWTAIDLRS